MKKLVLCAAIAAFGFSQVSAQDFQETPVFGFAEGDVILEGNINFNSTNNKNSDRKTNGFGVSPKVGYFLNDDFAIGAGLSFNSSKTEVSGTETAKNSGFGGGVFGRYYFLDLGARFKTYTELGVGYNTNNDKIADVKTNTIGAGLDLGINYFVTENIALSFVLDNLIGYSSSKVDVNGAESVSNLNVGLGSVNNPFGGNASFGVLFKF